MKKLYLLLTLSMLSLGVAAQNLVLNPGFELWDDATTPTSWTKAENVTQEMAAENVHSGTYSAKHTADGTKDISQTFSVVPGTNYKLSIWYKNEGGDGTDCRIWSNWVADGTNLTDDAAVLKGPDNGYFTSSTTWSEYSVVVTAPATATDFYFEVRSYGSAITYWDDFSFEEYTDVDPPVWEASYPMADNIMDVQFDLMAQLDETSNVYYVVLENDATAPTVAEVMAGTGSGGATPVTSGSFIAGTSATAETISGLVVETSYDVYVVAADDEATPNVQADVSLVEVTTVVVPDVLLYETFDSDAGGFTAVNITGDNLTWYWEEYGGNGYMEMSAYPSHEASEDWLISAPFDLDAATGEMISFKSANNFGDETTTLTVYLSNDFSGVYTADSIAAANWNDVTSAFTLSPGGSYSFFESGEYDISADTGTGYIAFVYEYPGPDNSGLWEIDDVMVTGFLVPGSDATLSDLQVDGATVDQFDAAKYTYTVELPAGTTDVPAVTYTLTDENASAAITDATDLTGDAAARTTTVEVTAQDGTTTQTYSVVFNPVLEVANLGELRASADETRKYVVTGEVLLSFQQSYRNKKYVQDATGGVEIDDSPGTITTTYAIGDGITGLEGTVEDYNGLLQFHPTADAGAASSTGNTITPVVATPAEINADIDMYESKLVTVEGGTIDEADGSTMFANGDNLTLNGATESMVLRVHFYGTTLNDMIIPDSANVTGIVLEYNGTAQLAPRSSDDVEPLEEYVPSNDATLSALMYDGTAVDGFSPAQLSYFVTLPAGTTAIPDVTATTSDENATVNIVDATDLGGDAAARTTSVEVTAEDGETMKTYTIEFSVEVSVKSNLFSNVQIFPVPATNALYLENTSGIESLTVFDITGTSVMEVTNEGEGQIAIDISSLHSGVYMIRMKSDDATGVARFVKQ